MLTFLAEKFRFLLVVVLAIIGISFIFFGSWTPRGGQISGPLGVIEGRKIKREEFLASERAVQIAHTFHTGAMMERNRIDDEEMINQTWGRLVALAAAREAGIKISDQEVFDAIQKNPLFQKNGKYSPEMLQRFFQFFLTPQGVTPDRFQEIIREELVLGRLLKQIGDTAVVNPREAERVFKRLFGKATASVVRFSLKKTQKEVRPTDEELKAFYEEKKSSYMETERRNIEYVEFRLSSGEQKLPEDEKAKTLAEMGEKAFDFTGLFLNETDAEKLPDFKTSAEKMGLTAQKAEGVTSGEKILPELKREDLTQAVFDLSKDNPVSDYIPVDDGFVVFHLVEINPSKPIPFENARERVKKDYIAQKAVKLLREQANTFRKEAAKKLKEGVSWEKTASQLKQKARNLPPFIPAESEELKTEDAPVIRSLVQFLEVGQMSGFQPTEDGGIIVYLKKRTPPDEEHKKVFPQIQESLTQRQRKQIIEEWFYARLRRPETQLPPQVVQKFKL